MRGGKILLAVSTTRRNYNVAWCVAQRVALELRNADKGTDVRPRFLNTARLRSDKFCALR